MPDPPAPALLPPNVSGFAGREAALARLDAILDAAADQPTAVVISTLSGSAGVGKTALAVHWAHRVRDRFPDGQLFVDLRGYSSDPPVRPIEALARFLAAFGVPGQRVPAVVDEAVAMYRSLLAGKKVLVVLDNAASVEQVRPLLPGSGACVVVTSRERLGGLVVREDARNVSVGVLSPQESRALLAGLVGLRGAEAAPAAVAELAELCGHLPLALRVAAAQLSIRPEYRIADLVARLRDKDRLAALAMPGDTRSAVVGAFDLSYAQLPPAAGRLFRLIGITPGSDFTPATAAALLATSVERAAALLEVLASAHLVEERMPGRYACHDLLRSYAGGRAQTEETARKQQAALTRFYDHYLHASDAAADIAYPQALRLRRESEAPEEVHFPDSSAALTWFDAEIDNLVDIARHAGDRGGHRWSVGIADNLRGYFWLRMNTALWEKTAHVGPAAAEATGDIRAQAAAKLGLTSLCWRQSRHREAADHGAAALALARRDEWVEGQAAALGNLGLAWKGLGEPARCRDHLEQALLLYDTANWRHGRATVLTNLGSICIELGEMKEAVDFSKRALATNVELGSRNGQAISLTNLGCINCIRGQHQLAREQFAEAESLYRALGSSSGLSVVRRSLALLHSDLGNHERAAELAASAVALAQDNHYCEFAADALNVLATVHQRLGHHEQAVHHHMAAQLAAAGQQTRWSLAETEAHVGLAAAYHGMGDHQSARSHVEQALNTAQAAGFGLCEAQALTVLARLEISQGRIAQACRVAERALAAHRALDHLVGEASTHLVLADARRRSGESDRAADHHRRATRLFSSIAPCRDTAD